MTDRTWQRVPIHEVAEGDIIADAGKVTGVGWTDPVDFVGEPIDLDTGLSETGDVTEGFATRVIDFANGTCARLSGDLLDREVFAFTAATPRRDL